MLALIFILDGNACVNTSDFSTTPKICNNESLLPAVASSVAENKLLVSTPSKCKTESALILVGSLFQNIIPKSLAIALMVISGPLK